MLSRRGDLEDLAVVAGLAGNTELPAAIEAGHDWHHGDDGLAGRILKRGLHACLPPELDQVARGRKRQLEAPALATLQRLARRHPDRVGRFLAVMGTELVRRRG